MNRFLPHIMVLSLLLGFLFGLGVAQLPLFSSAVLPPRPAVWLWILLTSILWLAVALSAFKRTGLHGPSLFAAGLGGTGLLLLWVS